MAKSISRNYIGLFTVLGGFIFLILGAWLTISSLNTTVVDLNPWFLTPIGVIIAVIGMTLIISRDE
jgi:hypothetical protein